MRHKLPAPLVTVLGVGGNNDTRGRIDAVLCCQRDQFAYALKHMPVCGGCGLSHRINDRLQDSPRYLQSEECRTQASAYHVVTPHHLRELQRLDLKQEQCVG